MLRGELIASPLGGQTSQRIELCGVDEARAGPVVVATDDYRGHGADAVNDGVRVRPVADQVAEAKDLVVLALGQGGAFLQGFQV